MDDDPISKLQDDSLGRGPFVDQVAGLIERAAVNSSSTVFGLVAPWGAGKTSLLHLIRQKLEGDNWSVAEFNPWESSDMDVLAREFIVALRSAIPDGKKGNKARKALKKYGRRALPIASVVQLPGINAEKALDAVLGLADDTDPLEELRGRLSDALDAMGAPVLVIIDDVDRLQEAELWTLLKLIRLVGRLPNIFYVIAYDETTLRDVLSRTGPGGGNGRAHEYMEKIVQVRVDVPPMHAAHRYSMIWNLVEEMLEQHRIVLSEEERRRLTLLGEDLIGDLLTGPRQIKRYFSQVDAFLPLVVGEVNFVDFCVVTAIRTFYPELHAALPQAERGLTGGEFRQTRETNEQAQARWQKFVSLHVNEERCELAEGLLAAIFPVVSEALRRGLTPQSDPRAEMGIASGEYFDRYFFLGLPPGDVADREVVEVLGELSANGWHDVGPFFEELAQNPDQYALVLRKLERLTPIDGAAVRKLLPAAALVVAGAPPYEGLGGPRELGKWWLTRMLAVATLDDPRVLLDQLLASMPTHEIAWAVLRGEPSSGPEPENHRTRGPLRAELILRIRAELAELTRLPVADSPEIRMLLLAWEYLTPDTNDLRDWLRSVATQDPWTVADVTSLFVADMLTTGNGAPEIDTLDRDRAERLLGLDFILDHVEPESNGRPIDWYGEVALTHEERLRRMHASLARLADEQHQDTSD